MKKFTIILALFTVVSCKKEDPEPTPLQPLTSLGSQYAGGMVVYLEEGGQHGLVICNEDLGEFQWSSASGNVNTQTALGTGKANTDLLVTTYPNSNFAANVCDELNLNGYSDWWLPSDRELFEVLHAGAFHNLQGSYWTSSQAGQIHSAFSIRFNPTALNSIGKDFLLKVRAVRKF